MINLSLEYYPLRIRCMSITGMERNSREIALTTHIFCDLFFLHFYDCSMSSTYKYRHVYSFHIVSPSVNLSGENTLSFALSCLTDHLKRTQYHLVTSFRVMVLAYPKHIHFVMKIWKKSVDFNEVLYALWTWQALT